MSINLGSIAPDFILKNTNGENVSLNSFKGKKVVLLFFPFANAGVCTKEMCSMRDSMSQYSELNAEVLGISVDSPFGLKLWKEHNQINFQLLSDFNKEVAPVYGTFYDVFAPGKFDYRGVAKRSAFVIDETGVVKYAEVLENAGDEPNYGAIQVALK